MIYEVKHYCHEGVNKGKLIESKTYDIHFDAEHIIINGKQMRVKHDKDFTYKLQKTQIRANMGVNGLYDFFQRAERYASCLIEDICLHVMKYGKEQVSTEKI